METGRLGGLDLLRGIAALCVVGFHIHYAFPHIVTPFSHAYLAVDFFFMLSGFVLTRTYHQRFLTGLGATRFMVLRLRRLWPTIAIGAAVGLLSRLDVYSPQELTLFFAMNLALIPYLAGGPIFPVNGVTWSIVFELVANLLHAKVLARLSRVELLMLSLAMALIMVIAVMRLASFGAGSWDVGAWQGNFAAGLPRVMLAYVIGSMLYRKFGDQAPPRLPAWIAPVLLPGALLVRELAGSSWIFDLLFVVLVCPAVLVAGLASFSWAGRLERIAGDLSFPLYAVHMPVLMLVAKAGLPWFVGPPMAILVAALTLGITKQASRLSAHKREARLPVHSQA